jgi:hypothetical protein
VFTVLIRLTQKTLNFSYFFGRRVACAKSGIFCNDQSPKNAETTHIMFRGRDLVSVKWVRNTGCSALCRFLSAKRSVTANRRKGFYTSRLPKNEEIGGIFVFRGLELLTLFKTSK